MLVAPSRRIFKRYRVLVVVVVERERERDALTSIRGKCSKGEFWGKLKEMENRTTASTLSS
jgi:hypothetical protein